MCSFRPGLRLLLHLSSSSRSGLLVFFWPWTSSLLPRRLSGLASRLPLHQARGHFGHRAPGHPGSLHWLAHFGSGLLPGLSLQGSGLGHFRRFTGFVRRVTSGFGPSSSSVTGLTGSLVTGQAQAVRPPLLLARLPSALPGRQGTCQLLQVVRVWLVRPPDVRVTGSGSSGSGPGQVIARQGFTVRGQGTALQGQAFQTSGLACQVRWVGPGRASSSGPCQAPSGQATSSLLLLHWPSLAWLAWPSGLTSSPGTFIHFRVRLQAQAPASPSSSSGPGPSSQALWLPARQAQGHLACLTSFRTTSGSPPLHFRPFQTPFWPSDQVSPRPLQALSSGPSTSPITLTLVIWLFWSGPLSSVRLGSFWPHHPPSAFIFCLLLHFLLSSLAFHLLLDHHFFRALRVRVRPSDLSSTDFVTRLDFPLLAFLVRSSLLAFTVSRRVRPVGSNKQGRSPATGSTVFCSLSLLALAFTSVSFVNHQVVGSLQGHRRVVRPLPPPGQPLSVWSGPDRLAPVRSLHFRVRSDFFTTSSPPLHFFRLVSQGQAFLTCPLHFHQVIWHHFFFFRDRVRRVSRAVRSGHFTCQSSSSLFWVRLLLSSGSSPALSDFFTWPGSGLHFTSLTSPLAWPSGFIRSSLHLHQAFITTLVITSSDFTAPSSSCQSLIVIWAV